MDFHLLNYLSYRKDIRKLEKSQLAYKLVNKLKKNEDNN